MHISTVETLFPDAAGAVAGWLFINPAMMTDVVAFWKRRSWLPPMCKPGGQEACHKTGVLSGEARRPHAKVQPHVCWAGKV